MAGVPHATRRLLAALVVAGAGVVLTGPPAQACSCEAPSVARAARQADVVFTGQVVAGRRTGRQVDLSFQPARVYAGEITTDPVDVASPDDSCGLDPTGDQRYLVFAVERRGALASDLCRGSTPARQRVLGQVQRALGPGEAFQEPPPPPPGPAFTRVLEEPPPDFTRTAAPGAALALIGLLGWFVVRRRS